MRSKRRTLLDLIAGFLVATTLFELALRATEYSPLWKVLPAAEIALYGPDPDTGYTIRPQVSGIWLTENRTRVRTSRQGLRDSDIPFRKPEGEFRVALAGDSITEALQVCDRRTFADLLETRLSRKGQPVEVINLGMSGALPPVQVVRMDTKGKHFSPDLMVYMVSILDFASDALQEDFAYPGYRLDSDGQWKLSKRFRNTLGYRFRQSLGGQLYYWALDHLRVFRVVNARRNRGFSDLARAPAALATKPNEVDSVEVIADALRNWDHTDDVGGVLHAFLRDVSTTAHEAGVPAVLAVRGLAPSCQNEKPLTARMKDDLIARLESLSIGFIDMDRAISSVMARSDLGGNVNVLYGFGAHLGFGHLNYLGHEIYAKALSEELTPWLNRSV